MKRLTNSEIRMICDGKSDYQAELYNRLAEIEDWIEEQIGDKEYDLKDYVLVEKDKCYKKAVFKPYLRYSDDRVEFFNDFIELFGRNKKKMSMCVGYIGNETKFVDSNGVKLKVGDVVSVEDLESSFETRLTYIATDMDGDNPKHIVMGYADFFNEKRFKITLFKRYKDLKHNEKHGNLVAILKEEK